LRREPALRTGMMTDITGVFAVIGPYRLCACAMAVRLAESQGPAPRHGCHLAPGGERNHVPTGVR
jgi:hypothetical protein